MLDRTRRLVSGAVDLAKEALGPGRRIEEGRAALDPFADALDAHVGDLRLAVRADGDGAKRALEHLQVAEIASEAVRPAVKAVKTDDELAAARRQVEDGLRAAQRAWAEVEGRPAPVLDAPLLDGLCAFDPRHGKAVEARPVTSRTGNEAEVPVCRGCAVLIGKGVTPEVRKSRRDGHDVSYYDGPGWGTIGLLPVLGSLDGGSFLSDVFSGDGDGGDGGDGWGDDGGDGGGD